MATTAATYKENGYTHVMLSIENLSQKPLIAKGFKSKRAANKYEEKMDLHERNSHIYEIVTVAKAIKKGY